jgi:hypothetical protein
LRPAAACGNIALLVCPLEMILQARQTPVDSIVSLFHAAKDTPRFVLRVGKELHREIAIKAMRSGESLNNYCQKVLKKAVGER